MKSKKKMTGEPSFNMLLLNQLRKTYTSLVQLENLTSDILLNIFVTSVKTIKYF